MYLETYFQDLLRGRKKGFWNKAILGIFYLLSLPHQAIVVLRNRFFDQGWFTSYSPPVPLVISIGNLVAGGTGKTPVTLLLAKTLSEIVPTAILSRGYRSESEKLSSPVLLHKEAGIVHTALYAGDEPFLLAENVEKAKVYVGKNRVASSNLAAKGGALAIVLDDGFQHRRLARDFDLVVIDAEDPFGQGYFLPRGFLRDQICSLARADLVILNHVRDVHNYLELSQQIAQATQAPVVGTRVVVSKISFLNNEPIDTLAGQKIALFCGIGKPESFLSMVQDLGSEIVASKYFPDHTNFLFEEIRAFASRASALGASMLVCTEKDKVKLLDFPEVSLPVVWVKTDLEIVQGESHWEEFLEKISQTLEMH